MSLKALLLSAPFLLEFCSGSRPPPPLELPPASTVPESALAPMVRINMRDRFRGSGVVVDKRHVVTSEVMMDGWQYASKKKRSGTDDSGKKKDDVITVGRARLFAKAVAVDPIAGLLLLETEKDLPVAVRFGEAAKDDSTVVMVGYFEVGAQLEVLRPTQFSANVSDTNSNVESVGRQDTVGSLELRSGRNTVGFWRGGAPVLEPDTGRLLGLVFGGDHPDDYLSGAFYAIPVAKIKAFLTENGIEYAE